MKKLEQNKLLADYTELSRENKITCKEYFFKGKKVFSSIDIGYEDKHFIKINGEIIKENEQTIIRVLRQNDIECDTKVISDFNVGKLQFRNVWVKRDRLQFYTEKEHKVVKDLVKSIDIVGSYETTLVETQFGRERAIKNIDDAISVLNKWQEDQKFILNQIGNYNQSEV